MAYTVYKPGAAKSQNTKIYTISMINSAVFIKVGVNLSHEIRPRHKYL